MMPEEEFRERLAKLIAMAKSSKPAEGFDEVLVAGEPEWRNEDIRSCEGVPVSRPLWETMSAIAARHGVTSPLPTR
jgi:LDH2 family malate/lactate/ureidoglycolate dehydrogenase